MEDTSILTKAINLRRKSKRNATKYAVASAAENTLVSEDRNLIDVGGSIRHIVHNIETHITVADQDVAAFVEREKRFVKGFNNSEEIKEIMPLTSIDASGTESTIEITSEEKNITEFLYFYRLKARSSGAAVRIQSIYRMCKKRKIYLAYTRRKASMLRDAFCIWVMSFRARKMSIRSILRTFLQLWRIEIATQYKLRNFELQVFTGSLSLPIGKQVLSNHQAKMMKHVSGNRRGSYVDLISDDSSSEDRRKTILYLHRQMQNQKAHLLLVDHFQAWKGQIMKRSQNTTNAQLCLKRVARLAFTKSAVWEGERLLTVFTMWHRWGVFKKCHRNKLTVPCFSDNFQLWNNWIRVYEDRQFRILRAHSKFPVAICRRFFRRLNRYAAGQQTFRLALVQAVDHFSRSVRKKLLKHWRKTASSQRSSHEIMRKHLFFWREYKLRVQKSRPIKAQILLNTATSMMRRMWRLWYVTYVRFQQSKLAKFTDLLNVQQKPHVLVCGYALMPLDTQFRRWKLFRSWRSYFKRRYVWRKFRDVGQSHSNYELLSTKFQIWRTFLITKGGIRSMASLHQPYESFKYKMQILVQELKTGKSCDSITAAKFAGDKVRTRRCSMTSGNARLRSSILFSMESVTGRNEPRIHDMVKRGNLLGLKNYLLGSYDINLQDANGDTALHTAVRKHKKLTEHGQDYEATCAMISYLLECGIDTNMRNHIGDKAVDVAPPNSTVMLLLQNSPKRLNNIDICIRGPMPQDTKNVAILGGLDSTFVWSFVAQLILECRRGNRRKAAPLGIPYSFCVVERLSTTNLAIQQPLLSIHRRSIQRRKIFRYAIKQGLISITQIQGQLKMLNEKIKDRQQYVAKILLRDNALIQRQHFLRDVDQFRSDLTDSTSIRSMDAVDMTDGGVRKGCHDILKFCQNLGFRRTTIDKEAIRCSQLCEDTENLHILTVNTNGAENEATKIKIVQMRKRLLRVELEIYRRSISSSTGFNTMENDVIVQKVTNAFESEQLERDKQESIVESNIKSENRAELKLKESIRLNRQSFEIVTEAAAEFEISIERLRVSRLMLQQIRSEFRQTEAMLEFARAQSAELFSNSLKQVSLEYLTTEVEECNSFLHAADNIGRIDGDINEGFMEIQKIRICALSNTHFALFYLAENLAISCRRQSIFTDDNTRDPETTKILSESQKRTENKSEEDTNVMNQSQARNRLRDEYNASKSALFKNARMSRTKKDECSERERKLGDEVFMETNPITKLLEKQTSYVQKDGLSFGNSLVNFNLQKICRNERVGGSTMHFGAPKPMKSSALLSSFEFGNFLKPVANIEMPLPLNGIEHEHKPALPEDDGVAWRKDAFNNSFYSEEKYLLGLNTNHERKDRAVPAVAQTVPHGHSKALESQTAIVHFDEESVPEVQVNIPQELTKMINMNDKQYALQETQMFLSCGQPSEHSHQSTYAHSASISSIPDNFADESHAEELTEESHLFISNKEEFALNNNHDSESDRGVDENSLAKGFCAVPSRYIYADKAPVLQTANRQDARNHEHVQRKDPDNHQKPGTFPISQKLFDEVLQPGLSTIAKQKVDAKNILTNSKVKTIKHPATSSFRDKNIFLSGQRVRSIKEVREIIPRNPKAKCNQNYLLFHSQRAFESSNAVSSLTSSSTGISLFGKCQRPQQFDELSLNTSRNKNKKRIYASAPKRLDRTMSLEGNRLIVKQIKNIFSRNNLIPPLPHHSLKTGPSATFNTMDDKSEAWNAFINKPISQAVHSAYSELYPMTYTMENKIGDVVGTPSGGVTLPAPGQVHPNDMKFWRSVENYKAIGTTSYSEILTKPSDSNIEFATQQHRLKRAHAIYLDYLTVGGRCYIHWTALYPELKETICSELSAASEHIFDEIQNLTHARIYNAKAC